MIYTAANSSLQKRAEEAVRFALSAKIEENYPVFEYFDCGTATQNATGTTFTMTITDRKFIPIPGSVINYAEQIFRVSAVSAGDFTAAITLTTAITTTVGGVVQSGIPLVRRSDDMRSREGFAWLVFVQVVSLKQDDPGSDYYTGTLVVTLHSLLNTITAEDGTQVTDSTLETDIAPHDDKASEITAALNNPVTLWNLVKPGAANRPVADLGIIAIHEAEEPGQFTVEGTHNFETRRKIRIVAVD